MDLDEETGEEIYSERKVNALKETAMIVYIKRDTDYLASKIAGDSNRPTLSETNSFKEIMERRGPWYERAADLILDGSLESGSGGSNENNKNTNNETTGVGEEEEDREGDIALLLRQSGRRTFGCRRFLRDWWCRLRGKFEECGEKQMDFRRR